jgi:hypothetical protein
MNKQIIDSQIISKKKIVENKKFDINRDIYIEDVIRSLLGSFWYKENDKIKPYTIKNNFAQLFLTSKNDEENEEEYVLVFDKNNFTTEVSYENNLEYPQIKYDPSLIESFFNSNLQYNKDFIDHFTSIQDIVLNVENYFINANYYKINKYYNYFSSFYEDINRQLNSFEKALPNVYDLLALKSNDEFLKNNGLVNLSFDGYIKKDLFENMLISEDPTETSKQYFNKYAKSYVESDGLIKIQELINLEQIQSDRILLESELTAADKLIADKIPFPYYNYLEFSNNNIANKIVKSLKKYDLYNDLYSHFYNQTKDYLSPSQLKFGLNNPDKTSEDASLITIDFKEWLSNLILGETPTDFNALAATSKKVKADLLYNSLIKEVGIKSDKRTYKDLSDKKEALKYPLFYKIEKYLNSIDGTKLQTYMIPITDNNITKFFDTQVKYEKKYVYKTSICCLVVGNKYYFKDYYKDIKNQRTEDLKNGLFRFKVINNTSLQIIQIPYFQTESEIVQEPYDIPQIEISNYLETNNKLKISSLSLSHTESQIPQYVEDVDFDLFDKVKNFQNSKDLVTFKNKSGVKKVQIYKTIHRPTVYSDFSGFLVNTITLDKQDMFSITDEIIPNVTYFYMFRTLNEHNIPSNPTEVFKITLKDEDGLVYLQKEKIKLEKVVLENHFKNMKKYIQIIPSMEQTIIANDMEELEKYILEKHDSKTIKLGTSSDRVWNKKFKMRIRSKNSGKVLEFYFKFKYNNN